MSINSFRKYIDCVVSLQQQQQQQTLKTDELTYLYTNTKIELVTLITKALKALDGIHCFQLIYDICLCETFKVVENNKKNGLCDVTNQTDLKELCTVLEINNTRYTIENGPTIDFVMRFFLISHLDDRILLNEGGGGLMEIYDEYCKAMCILNFIIVCNSGVGDNVISNHIESS